ncbi:SOS response-associated peptidase family protein [Paraglaciecola psychrophila]|uniref:Uncharacterized protein n=1 Tax=Paraglaciecola psychrophila 170 TaxID=1129794 RepID=K7ADV6_9ALTE|nr:SOS response-associated peptidase family protein [Paraglaciecola psychrophila]AGH44187.1 hypothetical protein C427_2078 [Paraglaciecola psychrophila 170]GAC40417.1 hypothetical protein GPSY_4815 [Paraglaciecola psychrophila 170]
MRVGTRATFNARNLDISCWQSALHYNRAIVLATGIDKYKVFGKTKHQHYVQSDEIFVIGALYRKISESRYSCAVLTKDAHPKMEPHHDKACPAFLPNGEKFLKLWLSRPVQKLLETDHVLNYATLYSTLKVQRVKTYKDKVPYQSFSPVILHSDLLVIQRSG